MMDNKKIWAEKFQKALESDDSLERYALDTNWWNDFKSQLMIVMEVYDFELDGGDSLLGSEFKFDNSKLIKEGDYEDRKNLINKMKDLNKDSIKTMQDFFMINPTLKVNKDYQLINREAYDLLMELFEQNGVGPSIRLFIDDIKNNTETNNNLNVTGFIEGNDIENDNQYLDLDTIQLGFVIKYEDRTILEVGYYPKNMSLSRILTVVTKKMNMDYELMVVDKRISSTQIRKENPDQIEKDKEILRDKTDEDLFNFRDSLCLGTPADKTLAELGIQKNQIIIFTDQYYFKTFNQNKCMDDMNDLHNFNEILNYNDSQQYQYNSEQFQGQDPFKVYSINQKSSSQPEKRGDDFRNKVPFLQKRAYNLNIMNSDNNGNRCSNATLESTYDSPTQIHNNSMDDLGSDDDDEDRNMQNMYLLNKGNDSFSSSDQNGTEKDKRKKFDNKGGNGNNIVSQRAPLSHLLIGQAKSQEEIDQIKEDIKNSMGKSGTLQMQKLTNQQVIQNMMQMMNQTQLQIQEQLQQRAKQEKSTLQAQQLDKLRFKDFSNQKLDDSERTSSTSTQPDNIKKKKRRISSNILFDEPHIMDAEEGIQFNN